MIYTAEIKLTPGQAELVKKSLAEPGHMYDGETFQRSASFLDGKYLVEVRAVGRGDKSPAWTEARLSRIAGDGTYVQISLTGPGGGYIREWRLHDKEGNEFVVTVTE